MPGANSKYPIGRKLSDGTSGIYSIGTGQLCGSPVYPDCCKDTRQSQAGTHGRKRPGKKKGRASDELRLLIEIDTPPVTLSSELHKLPTGKYACPGDQFPEPMSTVGPPRPRTSKNQARRTLTHWSRTVGVDTNKNDVRSNYERKRLDR